MEASNNIKIPTMIKLREASELTGISYYRLLQLCKEGKVTHITSGRIYYINLEKLVEYLNDPDGVAAHGKP